MGGEPHRHLSTFLREWRQEKVNGNSEAVNAQHPPPNSPNSSRPDEKTDHSQPIQSAVQVLMQSAFHQVISDFMFIDEVLDKCVDKGSTFDEETSRALTLLNKFLHVRPNACDRPMRSER